LNRLSRASSFDEDKKAIQQEDDSTSIEWVSFPDPSINGSTDRASIRVTSKPRRRGQHCFELMSLHWHALGTEKSMWSSINTA
jgi:hypothetical protein